MTRDLKPGYSVEIDSVEKEEWNAILEQFDDASIYQSWSYEAVISGERNLSHLLLKRKGELLAAAQARIRRIPFTNFGAAYIRWGPMWKLRGKEADPEVFEQVLFALRREYASRRRLVMWILPLLFDDSSAIFDPILTRAGFTPVSVQVQRTLLVPLENSLQQLRKGVEQKWRNRLNRAEKNSLRIVEGCDDNLFEQFIEVYNEMHERKQFVETSDVHQFRLIQRDLPERFQMKILIAFSGDKPAAGLICSKIGEMGMYLFAATSNAGLNSQGSYLLQWRALGWLKENDARWYNLQGINPELNPGTFRFKSGLCGKNGKDVHYLGTYQAGENFMASNLVWLAIFARNLIRRTRSRMKRSPQGAFGDPQ